MNTKAVATKQIDGSVVALRDRSEVDNVVLGKGKYEERLRVKEIDLNPIRSQQQAKQD